MYIVHLTPWDYLCSTFSLKTFFIHLMIIAATFAVVISHPTFRVLSFTPAYHQSQLHDGKTIFYGKDLMILILLPETGGFIWKISYLNSFVTFAKIYQIHCCSNSKTGAQHISKHATVERELTWQYCGSLWWVHAVKKPRKTSNSYSLLYSYLQCMSTERRGKPLCTTQVIHR